MGWGVLGSNFGGRVCVPVIVLFLFYVNVSGMPPFDHTSYLGSPLHQVVYPPGSMVPPWVTASHFLAGNREAELRLHFLFPPNFPCFPVFPLLLTPHQYSTFECYLLRLLNNNNNKNNNNNIYIGKVKSGFNCWGVRGLHLCYSCFT